jgi:hypothetical protein
VSPARAGRPPVTGRPVSLQPCARPDG